MGARAASCWSAHRSVYVRGGAGVGDTTQGVPARGPRGALQGRPAVDGRHSRGQGFVRSSHGALALVDLYERIGRAIRDMAHAADVGWGRKRVNGFHVLCETLVPRGTLLPVLGSVVDRRRLATATVALRGYATEVPHVLNLFTRGGALCGQCLPRWARWPSFPSHLMKQAAPRRRRHRSRDVFTNDELQALETAARAGHPIDEALLLMFTHTGLQTWNILSHELMVGGRDVTPCDTL